jgi:uncharacterized membrane protein YqjE
MPTATPTPTNDVREPSLAELLRLVIDEAQTFLRAEISLLKAESTQTLKIAALILVLVMSGGTLLVMAFALVGAAVVLAAGGDAVQALLAAAGVDALFGLAAGAWLWSRLRSSKRETPANETRVPVPPRAGSQVS